ARLPVSTLVPYTTLFRSGRAGAVVSDGVRQDDRVHLGVGQIEAAAERVAQLVVQRHADRGERHTAEPGAVQRLGARFGVLGLARSEEHTSELQSRENLVC